MSKSYGVFAEYYDRLTSNAEYKKRAEYMEGFFNFSDKSKRKVLDLACGTGSICKEFADMGYDVTGLDLSEEMLSIASTKANIRLLKHDMRNFNFENEFDACVCAFDSLNHLETLEDWKKCFFSVYSSLKDGGIFVFDVNTIYKHNNILADNAFIFDEDDFFLAWDNEGLENNKVRILLDFFIFNGENYDRQSEEFVESAFSVDEIKDALADYFTLDGVYDDMTRNAPAAESQRLYFVCKRK